MNPKQKKAYELYCSGLSYSEVAKKIKVTKQSVYKWSKEYNWKDKRDEILLEEAKDIKEKTLQGRELILETVDAGISSILEDIKKGKQKPTVKELAVLIDAYIKMQPQQGGTCGAPSIQFSFDVKGKPEDEVEEDGDKTEQSDS